MGVSPEDLEIIFEVKREMSNEKITRKKKSFPTYKMRAFSVFLDPFNFQGF